MDLYSCFSVAAKRFIFSIYTWICTVVCTTINYGMFYNDDNHYNQWNKTKLLIYGSIPVNIINTDIEIWVTVFEEVGYIK